MVDTQMLSLHTALSSYMITMYCIQFLQNVFDIFVNTWKSVHVFCISEQDEELETRRKRIFELPQTTQTFMTPTA